MVPVALRIPACQQLVWLVTFRDPFGHRRQLGSGLNNFLYLI